MVKAIKDLLADALMGSVAVVVMNIPLDDAMQLFAMKNEHVVKTFSSQTADEALTEGISPGSTRRRFQYLNAAGDCGKVFTILGISVADQIFGQFAPGGCLAQVLGSPWV